MRARGLWLGLAVSAGFWLLLSGVAVTVLQAPNVSTASAPGVVPVPPGTSQPVARGTEPTAVAVGEPDVSPDPVPDPVTEPTTVAADAPDVSPDPVPDPVTEPTTVAVDTPDVSPDPVPDPVTEPTTVAVDAPDVSPDPVPDPVTEPTTVAVDAPDVSPDPTPDPTTDPTQVAALNPDPTPDPTTNPTPDPTTDPTPDPTPPPTPPANADGMLLIPGGTFTMGHASIRDNPPHPVTLRPYLIDRSEVTQEAYRECSREKACQPSACWEFTQPQETRPIACVTWTQAKTYCEWRGKRLPTEAEWERAARGTDGRAYPWGDDEPTCALGHYGRCGKVSKPIGSLSGDTSPDGALDMAGNLAEWTADIFGPLSADPADNPTGAVKGKMRVLKGGHFVDSSHDMQAFKRRQKLQTTQNNLVGFRCARDAE